MIWIASPQWLEKCPGTLKLVALMGWDIDQTIGKLQRFWWWCVDHAKDGQLEKFDDIQLATVVGLTPASAKLFTDSMVEAKFLRRVPTFRVENWDKIAGLYFRRNFPDVFATIRKTYGNRMVTVRYSSSPPSPPFPSSSSLPPIPPNITSLPLPPSSPPSPGIQPPEKPVSKPKKGITEHQKALFTSFWNAYPRKVGKTMAQQAWIKLSPDDVLTALMLAAIQGQKRSLQWSEQGGTFIPYPATWLNQCRWEDEAEGGAPAISEQDRKAGWQQKGKCQRCGSELNDVDGVKICGSCGEVQS